MPSVMPRQRPGKSTQDVQTPPEFLRAVRHRLGIQRFSFDVAASWGNQVADRFYTAGDDALASSKSWRGEGHGWAWCNPPYADIAPWVRKAYEESRRGARIAMLIPAGVGANWWREWVHGKAYALLLNGRLTFVGHKTPYPKDCALLLYGPDVAPGYDVWTWVAHAEAR